MIRGDAHLLDVGPAFDLVDQDVADGLARVAHGHPGPSLRGVALELLDRRRLVLGHSFQAEVAETLPGSPLDVSKGVQVLPPGGPDPLCHPERFALEGGPIRLGRWPPPNWALMDYLVPAREPSK